MTTRLDPKSEIAPANPVWANPAEASLAGAGIPGIRLAEPWGGRGVNWIGLWTLCRKEVERFLKVLGQTILAPMATSVLFLAVFALALGSSGVSIGGVKYVEFLAPGLIMVAVAQNAFSNTSSSLIIAKLNGTLVDILMPPLSADELLLGYVVGGVARGLIVALAVIAAIFPFVNLGIFDGLYLIYFLFSGCLLFSLIGIFTGIWAEKFERVAAVTNFVVSPLALLSGSFYSIDRLPEIWQTIIHFNPMFFIIAGFRYGAIGYADGNLAVAAAGLLGWNVFAWVLCRQLVARGWRLKT
jgi:ABC-2 type transport system permease protein